MRPFHAVVDSIEIPLSVGCLTPEKNHYAMEKKFAASSNKLYHDISPFLPRVAKLYAGIIYEIYRRLTLSVTAIFTTHLIIKL